MFHLADKQFELFRVLLIATSSVSCSSVGLSFVLCLDFWTVISAAFLVALLFLLCLCEVVNSSVVVLGQIIDDDGDGGDANESDTKAERVSLTNVLLPAIPRKVPRIISDVLNC